MNSDRRSRAVERRDEGLALADALLESNRPMSALPEAVHMRVKRRLAASARQRVSGRLAWLQPAVIGGALLVCGAAFGIVLDRLVLKRKPSGGGDEPAAQSSPARLSRAKKARASGLSAMDGEEGAREKGVPVPETEAHSAPAAVQSVPAFVPAPSAGASPPTQAPRSATKRLAMRAGSSGAVDPQRVEVTETPAPVGLPAVSHTQATSPLPPATVGSSVLPTGTPSLGKRSQEAAVFAPAKVNPPLDDGLSEEGLLAAAARALRTQSDALSALRALDEYLARYPEGRLQVEAGVLRADAMTALRQPGEALRALDGLDFSQMSGGLERQLQRGDLRASAGRWREAEVDFAWVFSHVRAQDRDLSERALWGRARSRAHLGDQEGARLDAGEYLRRFPAGRFAAQAASLEHAGEQ